MANWEQFEQEAGELAAAVKARFQAHKHHVLATVRRDGSPRVSGTEVDFQGAELCLGSMLGAVKAADLRRDGRFALHSNPGGASMEGGDAKLSGRAVEVVDAVSLSVAAEQSGMEGTSFHLFRLDITEAVLTTVDTGRDALLIRLWRPGQPVIVYERRNDDPVPRRLAPGGDTVADIPG